MGVVRDVTIEQLTQAVGGIDTSGLAKDTTLQATNTALSNINTTLGGITTNDPPTDTTQQSIASAISGLGTVLGSDKANISGDNIANPSTFRQNIGITDIINSFGLPFTSLTTVSVYNCTGTITNNLYYAISDNIMVICGRVRIASISRTGENPGVKVMIPNSRVLPTLTQSLGFSIAPSYYADAFRNGENTMILFRANINDHFVLDATESYTNITNGKTLVLTIPTVFIRLNS